MAIYPAFSIAVGNCIGCRCGLLTIKTNIVEDTEENNAKTTNAFQDAHIVYFGLHRYAVPGCRLRGRHGRHHRPRARRRWETEGAVQGNWRTVRLARWVISWSCFLLVGLYREWKTNKQTNKQTNCQIAKQNTNKQKEKKILTTPKHYDY